MGWDSNLFIHVPEPPGSWSTEIEGSAADFSVIQKAISGDVSQYILCYLFHGYIIETIIKYSDPF